VIVLAIALAAAAGAPARYLVDGLVQSWVRGPLPYGTLTVNLTGSFVLGILAGLTAHHGAGPLANAAVGTGFCGAFTTWSTLSWETVRLVEERAYAAAVATMAGSLAAGLAVAALGYWLGS
jgi:CrcB protein